MSNKPYLVRPCHLIQSMENLVHIRIQQRNGHITLTTIQGIPAKYDLKKINRYVKREFSCYGRVKEHPEFDEVLQLQGDQRKNICQWLTRKRLVEPKQLRVHGF